MPYVVLGESIWHFGRRLEQAHPSGRQCGQAVHLRGVIRTARARLALVAQAGTSVPGVIQWSQLLLGSCLSSRQRPQSHLE